MIKNRISFNWDIHWKCNYNCKYCWFYGKWDELKSRNYYPEIKEIVVAWEKIYKLYGEAKISITGGEPFIYPKFKKLIKEISKFHQIEIITNLSTNIENFLKEITSEKIIINPSFHPDFADIDVFIKRAKLLKDYGFLKCITIVAYPPYVRKLKKYKDRFLNDGLELTFQSFHGAYKDKIYPDSYTEEEKSIIFHSLGERGGEKYRTEPIVTKGKKCLAGVIYGVIHPDGSVLRCGGVGKTDEEVGNIFDKNFKMLEFPKECTADMCPCNEWAFLIERNT